MKKLLIIYPVQFGYHTDTFKYCQHLVDQYDITYICFDQGLEKISIPNVTVKYCKYDIGKIKRLLYYFREIYKISHESLPEVTFTVHFRYSFIVALCLKSPFRILDYRTGDLKSNTLIRFMNNLFFRFDALFFDKVTIVSPGLQKIMGFNASNSTVLPLGADIISTSVHTYNRLDLLYVGIIHIRNIHQTIEGLGMYLQKYPDHRNMVSYTIIGFGPDPDIERIFNAIQKWNLTGIVRYLGRKKYTELQGYFDTCNIGISYIPMVPYYQHQPATKTFEYVLSGLFTIATNTHENRKVINVQNGILCEDSPESFCDAVEKLVGMRPNINEGSIRNSLSDFSWESIIRKTLIPILDQTI